MDACDIINRERVFTDMKKSICAILLSCAMVTGTLGAAMSVSEAAAWGFEEPEADDWEDSADDDGWTSDDWTPEEEEADAWDYDSDEGGESWTDENPSGDSWSGDENGNQFPDGESGENDRGSQDDAYEASQDTKEASVEEDRDGDPSETPDEETDTVSFAAVLFGTDEAQTLPESEHPYENDEDESWTYTAAGAEFLRVAFAPQTRTEENYDYIYLYDAADEQVGAYTGGELAGREIYVQGDTVRVRLTSDSSGAYYGFRITGIEAGEKQAPELSFSNDVFTAALGITDFSCALKNCTSNGEVCYESSDPTVAEIDPASGLVTVKGVGITEITARSEETFAFYEGTATCTITVMEEVSDALAYGMYGGNLVWAVRSAKTGTTLTISGSGPMSDQAESESVPWESYKNTISAVEIGEGVTSIGNAVFEDCTNLAAIGIAGSVTAIGDAAFRNCTSLVKAVLPDGVTAIGSRAFEGCISLASLTLPSALAEIGDRAFMDCSSLRAVTIPDGIRDIGDAAFSGCTRVTRVVILSGEAEIGSAVFDDCEEVMQFQVQEDGTYMLTNAVSEKLTVSIPSAINDRTVTAIGEFAFEACVNAVSVLIPDGIISIGDFAFSGCEALEEAELPASIRSIGMCAFDSCANLLSISIPDGVTAIEMCTFYDCESLTCVTIPDSVTSIGISAFEGCENLTGLTLPVSVTSVGYCAFDDTGLGDIYYGGNAEQWGKIEQKFPDDVTVHLVPTISYAKTAIKKLATAAAFTNPIQNDSDAVLTYTSSDPSVAEVDPKSGKVTPKAAGKTVITVSAPETEHFYAGTASYTLTLVAAGNTISATDITRDYSANLRKTLVGASCLGGAKLTYSSDNANVQVTSSGILKIAAKFYGTAKITISSAATTQYKAAEAVITVTVKPVTPTLSSMTNVSGLKVKFTWNRDSTVTGYEILYSKHSKFAAANVTKTVTSNAAAAYTTPALTKGKVYYAKIRSYKTVNGTKIYSSWSAVKKITIAK